MGEKIEQVTPFVLALQQIHVTSVLFFFAAPLAQALLGFRPNGVPRRSFEF
jgi:hypothetical protein